MSEEWQYQVRVDLPPATAELARRDLGAPELRPLDAILARHQATLTCQFDAFAGYVAEAERKGVGHYPLYEWTGGPDGLVELFIYGSRAVAVLAAPVAR